MQSSCRIYKKRETEKKAEKLNKEKVFQLYKYKT